MIESADCQLNASIFWKEAYILPHTFTPKQFVEISRDNISPWKCPACLHQFELDHSLDVDTLSSLPFAAVSDESLSLYDLQGNNHGETSDEEEECRQCGSHLLNLARQLEARSRKDLRVAHLNVCSLRNKIEEFKCLQLICKAEVKGFRRVPPRIVTCLILPVIIFLSQRLSHKCPGISTSTVKLRMAH